MLTILAIVGGIVFLLGFLIVTKKVADVIYDHMREFELLPGGKS